MVDTTATIAFKGQTARAAVGGYSGIRILSRHGTAESAATHKTTVEKFGVETDLSPPPSMHGFLHSDTKPLQVWEGVVKWVDTEHQRIGTQLKAKLGAFDEHLATIDLEWVHEQDRDLVRPGAVFYLTLFKRITRGSIQNSQEIRFRRLPNWSDSQVSELESAAESLTSKISLANDDKRI